jgi:hypothetical protein
MQTPGPREVDVDGVMAFAIIGLSAADRGVLLAHAGCQLGLLQHALGR